MTHVLFTTETISRELDWQILVASLVARSGVRCLIGRLDALLAAMASLRGAVVVGRVFDPRFPGTDLKAYAALRSRKCVFAHLDEEGAVFMGDQTRWRHTLQRRLDPRVLGPGDRICTWGEFQRDVYAAGAAESGVRVEVTGHPRFDFYRDEARVFFADDATALRARFGRIVLINTNISIANHGQGIGHAFSARTGYEPADPGKRMDHVAYWGYATRMLVALVQLAHRLSVELPEVTIVVRPHPSESIEFYQRVLGGVSNIVVTREGSVGGWLNAADAMIHHGCTTALEASMGTGLVVDYRAAVDPRFDKMLPSSVGVPCDTEDEVLNVIRGRLRGDALPDSRHELKGLAAQLFENLRRPAAPELVRVLEEMIEEVRPLSEPLNNAALRARRAAARSIDVAKRGLGNFSARRRQIRRYANGKFTGIHESDVADRLARIGRIHPLPVRATVLDSALLSIVSE